MATKIYEFYMRIIFLGASELGWECCKTLIDLKLPVVGILTIPQDFRISWSKTPVKNVRFRNLGDLAAAHQIPIKEVTQKMSDPIYESWIRDLKPDILVVIGWYYMLPRSLMNLAPLGAVGIHASLLPQYRGGAPLVWAVLNGEKKTGVTLFHFSEGVDDGDVIGQEEIAIGSEEDISDVLAKAIQASVNLVRTYFPGLAAGSAPRTPQDHAQATQMPQRTPDQGLLDWAGKTAEQAYNWIRAQAKPYPGAFTFFNGQKVILWKSRLSDQRFPESKPGDIVNSASGSLEVVCSDNRSVILNEVEGVSGKSMSGEKWIKENHKQLQSGVAKFENA